MALSNYKKVVPVGKFGTDFKLNIGGVNGKDTDYKTMPGVDSFTIDVDMSEEEFGDWLEYPYQRHIGTTKNIKFSGTMVCYPTNEVYQYLENVMFEGADDEATKSKIKWTMMSGKVFEAYVLLNPSGFGGNTNELVKLNFEFTVDGEPDITTPQSQG